MNGTRYPDGTLPERMDPGGFCLGVCPVSKGWPGGGQRWWLVAPNGAMGGIDTTIHQVTEHDDRSITVVPSILIYEAGVRPGWHGWLERGVWRSA